MKRYYDQKHKPEEYKIGDKVWLDMKDINTGQPKKKLDILCEGPFEITEKISNVAYRLNLPPSWKIYNLFHVSKLKWIKPDEFNWQLPHVTLHVHGDNWNATDITKAKLTNGCLEFLTTWTLPDGQMHELWELAPRMENDAPKLIKEFYKKHPQAPQHILAVTLKPGYSTTGINYSLPSEQELLYLARRTSNFPTIIILSNPTSQKLCSPHYNNNGKDNQKSQIPLLPPLSKTSRTSSTSRTGSTTRTSSTLRTSSPSTTGFSPSNQHKWSNWETNTHYFSWIPPTYSNIMSLSLQGIIVISTWACKLIANALTGCSVNFDHIFDPINTFQMQLPVFHSLLGSLRGIWCKIIYIVALVSPIWDIFSAQSGQEGVVLGLTMSSGSISQLGRWCQLGIRKH